jgi:hypothetical protein
MIDTQLQYYVMNRSGCGVGIIIATNCAVTKEFVVLCICVFYDEVVR